jgi:bla regulator protein BlaR1
MNIAYSVFGEIMTESLGWFLIHSLWQGALIGFLLFVSLILLRKNSAQIRYYLSLAALLMIVISSSLTFRKAFHYASEKQELREFILNQPDQLKDYLSGKDASITSYVKRDKFSRTRVLIRTGIQQNFHWIVSLWFIGLIVYFMRLTGGLYYQTKSKNICFIPYQISPHQRFS